MAQDLSLSAGRAALEHADLAQRRSTGLLERLFSRREAAYHWGTAARYAFIFHHAPMVDDETLALLTRYKAALDKCTSYQAISGVYRLCEPVPELKGWKGSYEFFHGPLAELL